MNLKLKASVKGNYKNVMAAFDRHLFEALKPPFGKMEIVAFTGSKKGDKVHLKFHSPIKAEWISEITEDEVTNEMASFVDVGIKLPWPLATWKHQHIVEKIDTENSMIIDYITFTASNKVLTLIMFPAIFLGFYPRKKVYKDYFKKLYDRNSPQ